MTVTFIMAAMSRTKNYIKTWQMEPLGIAQLAALTPKDVNIKFYDDRIEEIDYDDPTDLVAISMETYSAQRSYDIIAEYHKRGVKVVAGGFHPTLVTEEVLEHADSVVIGEAEPVWKNVIEDFKNNSLQKIYKGENHANLSNIFPDRSIFKGKKYLPLTLIESARGCRFDCNFCSVTAFYEKVCNYRSIEDVVAEIKATKSKAIFFVDDNIGSDMERARELFTRLIPLKINWISQISTSCLEDDDFVTLMRKSGCLGVLIGFESFNKDNLAQMNKTWNKGIEHYDSILKKMSKNNIFVYGTFVFGYDEDDENAFKETLKFAVRNNMILAAFNHLMPFPGTPLYNLIKPKLIHDKWWLENSCNFAEVVFNPKKLSAEQLAELCYIYKKKFYSFPLLLRRAWGLKWCFLSHIKMLGVFLKYNWITNKETTLRRGLKIGKS